MLLVLAVLWAGPALACTPGPDHERREREYFNAVTSVYIVQPRDFIPQYPESPEAEFTVKLYPMQAVWGPLPKEPVSVTYSGGNCVDWEISEADLYGLRTGTGVYTVYATPEALEDPQKLWIFRTDNKDLFLTALAHRTSAAAPNPVRDHLRSPEIWTGIAGTSLIFLLVGIFIRRFRMKNTKSGQT